MKNIVAAYELAKEQYASIGVDTDAAIKKLLETPISLHCWQGDDVTGFESLDTGMTGGIMSTGSYPGKARTPDELRADLDMALSLLPGANKVNLHAFYHEGGSAVDRDAISPAHFSNWIDWANEKNIGLDFNPSFFSHPKSADGTMSSADPDIRRFWTDHYKCCRAVTDAFGRATGKTSVMNIWLPDGSKERPIDSMAPRIRLMEALEEGMQAKYDPKYFKESVESKLFGIGVESYTVGSHEFYLAFAMKHPEVLFTMDTGHYHPTECVSAKLTALFPFINEILLHVSRPVRWDSDHVVTFDDELQAIAHELVRSAMLDRTYIATDYFDGSINRVAAWVIGVRNTRKALLKAMLEPVDALKAAEAAGDNTTRLALTEEYKTFPFGAVWNYVCYTQDMPAGSEWLADVKAYEQKILAERA